MSSPEGQDAAFADEPDPDDERTDPTRPSRVRLLIAALVVVALVAVGVFVWRSTSASPLERAYESCIDVESILDTMWDDLTEGQESQVSDEEIESTNKMLADLANEYIEGVLSLEDNGKTLVVSTKPQDEDPLGFGPELSLKCVYFVLDTPERVKESVANTRALDGRQSDSWGDFEAQWGYHPNSGLTMIITQD